MRVDWSEIGQLKKYHPLQPLVFALDVGVQLVMKRWSFSFSQNFNTPMLKGLYGHEVGNITLSFFW
jgi:hypothetical protein